MVYTNTELPPLLRGRNALVHGAGGAIGGAVARAFGRAGARVFLAGRTLSRLDTVAADIRSAGCRADCARVDALDADAVGRHADAVVQEAGGIDIALNAVGVAHVQGTPFAALSLDDYLFPISVYTRTNFITAQAVARHMAAGSHTRDVFAQVADAAGVSVGQLLQGAAAGTLLKRLPTLDQVANTAVFLASDHAGAITGTVANLSCGFLVD